MSEELEKRIDAIEKDAGEAIDELERKVSLLADDQEEIKKRQNLLNGTLYGNENHNDGHIQKLQRAVEKNDPEDIYRMLVEFEYMQRTRPEDLKIRLDRIEQASANRQRMSWAVMGPLAAGLVGIAVKVFFSQ